MIETARSDVKQACDLLIAASPEALKECRARLEQAAGELADFRAGCRERAPESGARRKLQALQAEVLRAGRLLQSLSTFYYGWEKILGVLSGGYTANGDPAPFPRLGRLDCRG